MAQGIKPMHLQRPCVFSDYVATTVIAYYTTTVSAKTIGGVANMHSLSTRNITMSSRGFNVRRRRLILPNFVTKEDEVEPSTKIDF